MNLPHFTNHINNAIAAIVFDETLWLTDEPEKRLRYAYRNSPDSCKEPTSGVITYPCCPFCGKRLGQDNKDFNRGKLCSWECGLAWKRRFNIMAYAAEINSMADKELIAFNTGRDGADI